MDERSRIEALLRKLDEDLIQGRISEEEYWRKRRAYEEQLAGLETQAPAPPSPPTYSHTPPSQPQPPPPPGYRGREMGLSDYFSYAADLCSKHPIILVPMIIIGVLSIIIILAVYGRFSIWRGMTLRDIWSIESILAGVLVSSTVLFILQELFSAWTIELAYEGIEGRIPNLMEGLGRILPKAIGIIAATIIVGIAVGIGTILCIIPGIILAVLFAFTIQGIIVDDLGVMDAMGKSFKVAKESFFEVFIVVIIEFIVIFILGIIPVIGQLLSNIAAGFFSVVFTVMYYYKR